MLWHKAYMSRSSDSKFRALPNEDMFQNEGPLISSGKQTVSPDLVQSARLSLASSPSSWNGVLPSRPTTQGATGSWHDVEVIPQLQGSNQCNLCLEVMTTL